MFDRPLDQLTIADIQAFIDDQWAESEVLEFKGYLPAKGNAQDPWYDKQRAVGERAVNEIIQEVIAFANAGGGTLILGVAETAEKPRRAESIEPLPAVAELADRLRLCARDLVEPQLGDLSVQPIEDEDRAGVIVMQVGQSVLAPHRHMRTRECYIRRHERSEKMTMREIRDSVLLSAGSAASVAQIIDSSRHNFRLMFDLDNSVPLWGFRVSLVPVSPLSLPEVGDISLSPGEWRATIGARGEDDVLFPFHGNRQPIVRGEVLRYRDDSSRVDISLKRDGLIECRGEDARRLRLSRVDNGAIGYCPAYHARRTVPVWRNSWLCFLSRSGSRRCCVTLPLGSQERSGADLWSVGYCAISTDRRQCCYGRRRVSGYP